MRNIFLYFLVCTILFSCKNEGCTDPLATNFDTSFNKEDGSCEYIYNLNVEFSLNDGDIELIKNDIISFENNSFRIEKFKLYLSDISLVSNNGTNNLTDVFLYNLEDLSTHSLILSTSDESVREFNFSLGLDNVLNSTTPADYPTDHPLGINNGTYWAMNNSDSYIFAMIEGKLDTTGDGTFFNRTYHLAHDDLLKSVSLEKSIEFDNQLNGNIDIKIELKDVFNDLNLSSTLPHTSNNSPLAHQIMDNIKNAFKIQ